MSRYRNLLPLFIIFVLPIIFFWKIILGETLFVGDMITLNYPLRVFVAECFKKGISPLWCPYLEYGIPILGEGQASIFYPLDRLLWFLFEPVFAYNYSVILHFFLAGLFMFIYLRLIMQDCWSALFGSITFMFSGVFITHLTYYNMFNIYIWLPLIFYFIEMFFRQKNFIYLIFTGVIFGIQFLGGYPQSSLQIWLALTIYFLYKCQEYKIKFYIRSLPRLFTIFLIGFGIYATQLFPLYEFLKQSWRSSALPYEEWTATSLSLPQLITFILPDFWGNPFKGVYIGDWNYIDLCGYLGIMPLILGLVAVGMRRDKYTFLFMGISFLGLLLAAGKYNPLYNFLYQVPIINAIRYPARYLYLYTFGMSVLAGLGLNHLLHTVEKRKRKVIFISVCLGIVGIFSICQIQLEQLVKQRDLLYTIRMKDWLLFIIISILSFSLLILYLKNMMKPSIFALLSLAILIGNIFIYWLGFNPTVKRELLTSVPESVTFLKKDRELYRILTWQWVRKKNSIARSIITKLEPFEEIIEPFKESICPNLSTIYEISSIDGFLGIALTRYEEFTQFLNSKLFSLANGKYIITPKNIQLPDRSVFSNERVNIFKNSNYLPRAFIVHQAKVMDKEKIRKEISSDKFNPLAYVLLEEKPSLSLKDQIKGEKEKIQIIKYLPTEVNIEVNLSQAGFLILTDTYYPGWEVYVNNKREKIYRADFLFRTIPLKAGNFKVRFVYNPTSFNLGANITLWTLILVGLYICWNVIRKQVSVQPLADSDIVTGG